MLDSIPEYDTTEDQKEASPLQAAGYDSTGTVAYINLISYIPDCLNYKSEGEEHSYMYSGVDYFDGEDGELSWFNAGVRVGVGIGLGVGLLVRTYQGTTLWGESEESTTALPVNRSSLQRSPSFSQFQSVFKYYTAYSWTGANCSHAPLGISSSISPQILEMRFRLFILRLKCLKAELKSGDSRSLASFWGLLPNLPLCNRSLIRSRESLCKEPTCKSAMQLHLDLSKIPIWVHLYNVPLELFSGEGLSYIASAIGASDTIPKFIDVVLNNGHTTSIAVEVPWMPPSCKFCKVFGHSVKGCKHKPTPQASSLVWRKKDPAPPISLDIETACTEDFLNSKSTDPTSSLNKSTKDNDTGNHSRSESHHFGNDSDVSGNPIKPDFFLTTVIDQGTSSDLIVEGISKIPNQPGNSEDIITVSPLLNKRGTGRPAKAHNALIGSSNRFDLLNSIDESHIISENQGKQVRAAASGVAELIKELKCKKRAHVDKSKRSTLGTTSFENWNVLTNYDFAVNGRIWFLWRKGLDLSLCNATDQSITVKEFQEVTQTYICKIILSLAILIPGVINKVTTTLLGNLTEYSSILCGLKLSLILLWNSYLLVLLIIPIMEYGSTSNPMKSFFTKLKLLKAIMKQLNKDYFSDISARARKKREELERQQILTLRGVESIEKELELQREFNSLEEAETMFLKQKAKLHWLKEGDKCTKFFHLVIATKNKRQTIRVLVNNRGERLESFEDISSEILEFFKNLLGSNDPKVKDCSPALLKGLMLPNSISSEDFEALVKEVTNDEIKATIFSQGNDKAPGPDSFTSLFFKKAWPVIGNDVTKEIKYFFQESFIYPAFNATTIALIPKRPNPSKVYDFRPISCCSVIYKTITKILANRMTNLLPKIIAPNQYAFVKERSIVDNTLLAQEIVKGYGRKIISPRCALKIDLQKAFDSINWDFIHAILKALDLPLKFIDWIVSCYTDARYSIVLNGSLVGYFKGAKGIRQGDPLSPTLFVLVMNVLSNILNKAALKGIFAFHPKCRKIGLTHLSFADDLLIFCKGNLESVMGVIIVLDCFYEYSGLKLNAGKCEIFTAGISAHNLDSIINFSGFKHGRLPVRYLGIPLVTRKLIDKDCQPLLGNIKSRIHQWSRKKMSYACRAELIKTVLYSVTNYWRSWYKGHQVLELAGDGSLWVAWIHNYIIRQHDFLTMEEPQSASWNFKRMLKIRRVAQAVLATAAKTTTDIWKEIRPKETKVPWHKLIWYPLHVPKHSLISWLVILDRLPTKDRLQRFGLITNDLYIFCSALPDLVQSAGVGDNYMERKIFALLPSEAILERF
ncbi:hypothetical protein F3Y22_tig00110893pilonHSYRG00157 [Hibiscus syriacus]|uniref:Reverse transcriptase domain-containing protein n=1 Tax=Hibiscus syriacus TaxID=106335 RepID=A0A6A2ZI52_HIBSY|nr:hypothetical protein F3Y22_tig00110893pilonHSYRG00157 [Hibiscus syriacus]